MQEVHALSHTHTLVLQMFWPLKIFYYVLPYSYYVRSALYMIFTLETWEPCTDPDTSAVCVDSTDGLDVLAGLERIFPLVDTVDTYWRDLGVLVLLTVLWKIAAVIVIIAKSRRVSSITDQGKYHPIVQQQHPTGASAMAAQSMEVADGDEAVDKEEADRNDAELDASNTSSHRC